MLESQMKIFWKCKRVYPKSGSYLIWDTPRINFVKCIITFGLSSFSKLNFPFTIQIGGTKILWHVVLEAIGLIAGYRYFVYLR